MCREHAQCAFCLAISIAMMYNIIYKLNLIEQIYMTEP
jgi:hypothetical protein